jgi:hypothetical protein
MSSSFLPRAGSVISAGAMAVALAGCGADPLTPDKIVASIDISPKSAQLYAVGQQVAFTSTVTTEAGTGGEGIPVGYVARDKTLLEVNSLGVAKVLKKGGSTYVVVTAGEKSDSALVDVPLTTCGSVTPTAMTVGQIVTDVGATGFCATASTGEYTVIAHNNSLVQTGASAVEVTGAGVGTAPIKAGPSFAKAVTPSSYLAMPTQWRRDVAAEMRHRRNEAIAVAPSAAGAAAWYAARSKRATRAAAAVVVGDMMTVNVNTAGSNGCTDARTDVAARVVAVSNSAIVLADPRNPSASGLSFTDAEYGQFAAMFDSVVNPLNVTTFGAPTDIDNNGRVLLVFTKSINDRTPANADYYIGGLTHSRDLAAKSSCPGSNQHLINFARRRYILPGAPQAGEELWLNEGLSHMAEELLYYRRTARTPRINSGANAIQNQGAFDLFYDYMLGNFLNYDAYAEATVTSSPFRSGDDITTRGATWSFLRYVADQKFTTDGSIWFNLVNSGESGATNLQNRLGVDAAGLRTLLRDFTVAVYADDYPYKTEDGKELIVVAPAKFTHPSWNMRVIYTGLSSYPSFDYPISSSPLKNSEMVPTTISTGGFKLYRFKGLSGVDSFIKVTGASGAALPSGITISVIRTK